MGTMTTTHPPTFPPRVISQDAPTPTARGGWAGRLPDQWLRGLLSGAEAAILSWLVVVVPAVATYVATAASPALGTADWMQAARVGTAAWLLGHGASLTFAGATISVVPLGVSLLSAFLVHTAVRRARLTAWPAVGFAVGTFLAFTGIFIAVAGVSGGVRALLGAAVVATGGALFGLRQSAPALLAVVRRASASVPSWARLGVRAALRALMLLLVLATIALVAGVVFGFSEILAVHESMAPDGVSTAVMVVAQLLLVPTLVIWVLAYLAGPGFAIGTGTLFSPGQIDAGALPVVPVLGALPEPGSMLGSIPFVVVVGIGVGAVVGVWLRRRARELDLVRSVSAAAIAAVVPALVVGLLCLTASGSIGPGRMAQVGPAAGQVTVAIGWQLLLGAVLAVVLLHPATARVASAARYWASAWWREVRTR